jgi:hypothetical protein
VPYTELGVADPVALVLFSRSPGCFSAGT